MFNRWLLLILVLLNSCTAGNLSENKTAGSLAAETTTGLAKDNDTEPKIILSELSQHDSIDDCWVSFEGKIYDLTKWLPLHPGGKEAILKYCGTSADFEKAFTEEHGRTKVYLLRQISAYKGKLVTGP